MELPMVMHDEEMVMHDEENESRHVCALCGAWTPFGYLLCTRCDRTLTSRQYADLFWDEV